MIFTPGDIEGAFLVTMDPHVDERGWFARSWCEQEFRDHGIDMRVVQTNVSFTTRRGTIRGLHWQAAPHSEAKLVRCVAGRIFDVVADVRPASPTFGAWQGFELHGGDRRLVFVPGGCAHGYQSLTEDTEVTYNTSYPYTPAAERGLRWNDPAFGVSWPIDAPTLSEKDTSWSDFTPKGVS